MTLIRLYIVLFYDIWGKRWLKMDIYYHCRENFTIYRVGKTFTLAMVNKGQELGKPKSHFRYDLNELNYKKDFRDCLDIRKICKIN